MPSSCDLAGAANSMLWSRAKATALRRDHRLWLTLINLIGVNHACWGMTLRSDTIRSFLVAEDIRDLERRVRVESAYGTRGLSQLDDFGRR